MGRRRATIRDVAALAAVSHQTVSRVINAQTSVAEPTRRRVLDAIEQLGYVPSPMARGLMSNRTHTLGMVTADVSDGFFARAVAGAEIEARRRNYYLIVGSVEDSPDDEEGTGYLRLMLDRRVEGLILARPGVVFEGEHLQGAASAGIPLVSVGSSELLGFTSVDIDNRRGGFDATAHLLGLGHRSIATIVGPREWPSADARLAGYRDALRDAGIAETAGLVARGTDWGLESGHAATDRLLASGVRFTAIFAHSDLIAVGAIRRLRSAGLSVPGDVSVVGYDDVPIAAYVDPPLTTVHQPMREVGEFAAALVLDRIAGVERGAGPHLLPARLVVRQSTAAPPAREPDRGGVVASVTFERVEKTFGDGTCAVDDLSLEIADGEFMVLVGPSGCGKTTALRLVAGLEDLSAGEIRIGDRPVQDLPPRRRDVAMVFQNYALYPHMNVFDNMAFGLRSRRIPRREAGTRVDRAARILDLGALLHRRPGQLSGGQRQRVAMGRAIVREPRAFLMDEPLSNLDAKLRVQMRAEISRLQRQLGATTIYVTHDQVEAMTMGDRVAVLRRGRLQQCAPPQELYDGPANLFVASFIGSPAMNFVQADVLDERTMRVGDATLSVPRGHENLPAYTGRAVALGIRPEHLRRAGAGTDLRLPARVVLTESLGPALLAHVELRGRAVTTDEVREAIADGDDALLPTGDDTVVPAIASLEPDDRVAIADTVELALDPRRLHFFDLETGAAIRA